VNPKFLELPKEGDEEAPGKEATQGRETGLQIRGEFLHLDGTKVLDGNGTVEL
jgi:hypothetical protein